MSTTWKLANGLLLKQPSNDCKVIIMKKFTSGLLAFALGASVFAVVPDTRTETLFDENLPTQTSPVTTSIAFKPKLGVVWGYDFDNKISGFQEIVNLDMEWEILPYKDYTTDSSGVEYGNPYGLVMFSGGHFMLKVQDQKGDLTSVGGSGGGQIDPYLTLNFEKIWGKVIWDPFYLVVAANETNFYERHTGWSFPTANNFVRANWAHMGNRVQGWTSPANTDSFTLTTMYDRVGGTTGAAGLGLGAIFDTTEILLQVATTSLNFDRYMTNKTSYEGEGIIGNKDNIYDFGLSLESNPIGDLQVRASAFTGVNYKTTPLGFSGMLGYRYDITNTISFVPHTAMDISFRPKNGDDFGSYITENTFGFDIGWPGSTGWADNPLLNKETNIFAGLTVDGSVVMTEFKKPEMSMAVSLHEDGAGGLIQNLGVTLVYENRWLVHPTLDAQQYYGVYVDYNIWNQFRPYGRFIQTEGQIVDNGAIVTEIGLEVTIIPSTVITLKYQTRDLEKAVTNKDELGLFTTSCIVTF